MTSITIKSNVGLVRQGLQDLGAEIPKIGRRRIYDAVNRITRTMEGYPPERARQTYVRTGTLYAGWQVKKLDDGYQIVNYAARRGRRYARYVVGDAFGTGQAWMHAGRWQLFRDVVEDEMAQLPPVVAREIELVARHKMANKSAVSL